MRAFGYMMVTLMLAFCAWAMPARAQDAASEPGPHLRITLVSDTDHPKAGDAFYLALDVKPQPGWHGYWLNPGDAGFAPKFAWTMPKGVEAESVAYPMPDTLLISGLMNYVYEKPYGVLVQTRVAPGLAAGTRLPIRLHLSYLVCTTSLCVPEQAELSIDLTVGDGAENPTLAANFKRWFAARVDAYPQWEGTMQRVGDTVRMKIDARRLRDEYPDVKTSLSDPYFFPQTPGIIDYAAPQRVVRDGDTILIETRAAKTVAPESALGILRTSPGKGEEVLLRTGSVPPLPDDNGSADTGNGWAAILFAFAGAVLGGLILNVMPCVFPILSLKALSLARAGGDERGVRHEALAYAAGAIAMCLALGATILALRAGGGVVGWAFQLQDPRVVILLLLLTVGIALNLAGAFELPVPRFAQGSGASGAFATGALAAFVATPCAGPFMGVALGAALVLAWPAALAVFGGLGLGLALPFLLLGFVPALRRKLPRPGAWMDNLRRVLSIPMWLTAVALAWVLGREAGVDAMGLSLLVALGFAVVLWAAGRRQARGMGFGAPAVAMLAMIAAAGVWLIHHRPAPTTTVAADANTFSEAKLAALRAQGRPVFVYFTADWCLTCKVNERVAIDTDRARAAFRAKNIAVLVGDWTNGDPVLGRFIEAHNRAGVPLYLYYSSRDGSPRVLPQVLTPSMLEEL